MTKEEKTKLDIALEHFLEHGTFPEHMMQAPAMQLPAPSIDDGQEGDDGRLH